MGLHNTWKQWTYTICENNGWKQQWNGQQRVEATNGNDNGWKQNNEGKNACRQHEMAWKQCDETTMGGKKQ